MEGALKNSRHERFAQSLAAGLSKQSAYKAAGYQPDRGAASRLSANVSILTRVEELQNQAAVASIITVMGITLELEHARRLALEKGQVSAAIAASLAKARINGLLTPEGEDVATVAGKAPETKSIDAMSLLEQRDLARRVCFILNKGNRAERLLGQTE